MCSDKPEVFLWTEGEAMYRRVHTKYYIGLHELLRDGGQEFRKGNNAVDWDSREELHVRHV